MLVGLLVAVPRSSWIESDIGGECESFTSVKVSVACLVENIFFWISFKAEESAGIVTTKHRATASIAARPITDTLRRRRGGRSCLGAGKASALGGASYPLAA